MQDTLLISCFFLLEAMVRRYGGARRTGIRWSSNNLKYGGVAYGGGRRDNWSSYTTEAGLEPASSTNPYGLMDLCAVRKPTAIQIRAITMRGNFASKCGGAGRFALVYVKSEKIKSDNIQEFFSATGLMVKPAKKKEVRVLKRFKCSIPNGTSTGSGYVNVDSFRRLSFAPISISQDAGNLYVVGSFCNYKTYNAVLTLEVSVAFTS